MNNISTLTVFLLLNRAKVMRNGFYQARILPVINFERTELNVRRNCKKTVYYCQQNCWSVKLLSHYGQWRCQCYQPHWWQSISGEARLAGEILLTKLSVISMHFCCETRLALEAVSFIAVAMNSRDWYEIIGLRKILHSITQPCRSVCLKKA